MANLGEIRQALTTSGVLSGRAAAAARIVRRSRAYLVHPPGHSSPRWVVKHVPDPQHQLDVRARLTRAEPALSRVIQTIVASASNWIVLDYVPGITLFDAIRQQIWQGRADTLLESRLVEAATELARVHRVRAAQMGIGTPPRSIGSFRACLQETWQRRDVARCLPHMYRDPAVLFDRFDRTFFDSVGCRLLLGDVRPKNIVASPDGRTCFIDVEFFAGHPGHEVGLVLVALDRAAIRYPWKSAQEQFRRWQQTFVDAYLGVSPCVQQELIFFYPWVLLRMLEQHLRLWPWLGSYIIRHYVRRLEDYLEHLGTGYPTFASHFDPRVAGRDQVPFAADPRVKMPVEHAVHARRSVR